MVFIKIIPCQHERSTLKEGEWRCQQCGASTGRTVRINGRLYEYAKPIVI